MDDIGDGPTEQELELQKRLMQKGGIAVPIEVIQGWGDNEKSWVEIWADNEYVGRTFRLLSNVSLPHCVRPYLSQR